MPTLGIEDLWKTYFCVATNYSQAREQVLRQRAARQRACWRACAIPGALPPVLHDGDLLCDGGMFNNFPADVMRAAWGVGRVVGVDVSFETSRRIEPAGAARGVGRTCATCCGRAICAATGCRR